MLGEHLELLQDGGGPRPLRGEGNEGQEPQGAVAGRQRDGREGTDAGGLEGHALGLRLRRKLVAAVEREDMRGLQTRPEVRKALEVDGRRWRRDPVHAPCVGAREHEAV